MLLWSKSFDLNKELKIKSLLKVSYQLYNDRPPFEDFFELHQVHQANLVTFKDLEEFSLQSPSSYGSLFDADGFALNFLDLEKALNREDCSQLKFAIKTADCSAALFLGNKGIVFLHSGWRGHAAGMLTKNEIKDIQPQVTLLGPLISKENYEVGAEFKNYFTYNEGLEEITDKDMNKRYYFDLEKLYFSHYQEKTQIIKTGLETYTNSQLQSFRRDKTKKRNYHILKIQK